MLLDDENKDQECEITFLYVELFITAWKQFC